MYVYVPSDVELYCNGYVDTDDLGRVVGNALRLEVTHLIMQGVEAGVVDKMLEMADRLDSANAEHSRVLRASMAWG